MKAPYFFKLLMNLVKKFNCQLSVFFFFRNWSFTVFVNDFFQFFIILMSLCPNFGEPIIWCKAMSLFKINKVRYFSYFRVIRNQSDKMNSLLDLNQSIKLVTDSLKTSVAKLRRQVDGTTRHLNNTTEHATVVPKRLSVCRFFIYYY